MQAGEQSFIEYLNYALALFGVIVVMMIFRSRQSRRTARQRTWVAASEGGQV